MAPYIRAGWDVAPDINIYIEAVHRLSNLGAVVTHAAHGTSHEGFDAEWREIAIMTFEGDLINRCEIFDEADIDAALARFDELSGRRLDSKTPRPGSTSAFVDAFNRRDLDGSLPCSPQTDDTRTAERAA